MSAKQRAGEEGLGWEKAVAGVESGFRLEAGTLPSGALPGLRQQD